MKKLLLTYFTLTIFFALTACSVKHDTTQEHDEEALDNDEWPMMDEFHMIMAESFHPFRDSSNIDPAIANAAEMASLAENWSASTLPAKVNNQSVKDDLAVLKSETASFAQLVQEGDKQQIGDALTRLHDHFHKLQEAWHSDHEHKH